jgi:hypothetical protein
MAQTPPRAYVLSLRMHVTSLTFSPLVAMELASFQHTTWPAMSTLNLTFYVGSTQLRSVRECVRACVRAHLVGIRDTRLSCQHSSRCVSAIVYLCVCQRFLLRVEIVAVCPRCRVFTHGTCRCCLTYHVSPIQPTATTCTHPSASCRPGRTRSSAHVNFAIDNFHYNITKMTVATSEI